jgi:NADH:ubiquinone reductase (H+-translocating)
MTSRVVIVGGGFGGLRAARALRSAPVEVTLIDRRNYHLFQPLLYQVATGSLAPGEIAAPLRGVLSRQKNVRVLLGEVADVDPASRVVVLADGGRFPYDALIVAAGSQTSYYGHEDWRQWAPSLKSVDEATGIRHKILYAFEVAERLSDPEQRRAWLTFVIVGAGATGVEMAGAIAEIARQTLKNDFRSIHPEDAQIILMDGAPRVLPTFPEDLSRKAERSLARLGVLVRTGAMVEEIDKDGLSFTTGSGTGAVRLEARTVIWAGGVSVPAFAKTLAKRMSAATDRAGRIKVDPDLTVPGHPDVFVVGDLAAASGRDGKQLPGVAQVAMQQGTYAGGVIARRIRGKPAPKPFKYFDKGNLAVIGRAAAVADVFGLHLWGLPAWLIWAFIHLMYIVQFQSRVIVFIRWALQDLTFNRGSRLITGEVPTDFRFDQEVAVATAPPRRLGAPSREGLAANAARDPG